jgi:hypothetical protein
VRNCADSQLHDIVRFRTRGLIELDQLDQARDLCIEELRSEWSPTLMTELWIESYVRDEPPVDANAAAELLASLAPPGFHDDVARDARCWFLRRLPEREQISRLEDLCPEHRDSLVPLLLALPEREFERLLAPLLDETVTDADLRRATLLAETGRSALKPALDELEALAKEQVKVTKDTWVGVNERRARLARP